jgi:large subunit ribosomal protein L9
MKVLFLENVPNLGKAGDVKEVNDGYARNYLLPKKLALLADAHAQDVADAQRRKRAKEQAKTEAEMRELAKMLEGKELTFKSRSGEKGKLYGSITSTDIAAELEKKGLTIDKRKIDLPEPIHQLGNYDVLVKLSGEIEAKLKVNVVEEEAQT